MKSGRRVSSSPNSSTMISRYGSGSSGCRPAPCTGRCAHLVLADRVDVAGVAQHPLATLLLALQRRLHPVDERQVVGEVGDQARHVRQFGQRRECRAALEVDQHEAEQLRASGSAPGP